MAAMLFSVLLFTAGARAGWTDIEWGMSLPEPPAPKVAATKPATTQAGGGATKNADDDIAAIISSTQPSTQAATKPALRIPPGKPWTVKVMTKGIEITMLFPEGWERMEPTDKNPPVIYKQGKEDKTQIGKTFQRASWYFLIVESKRDKPEKVLGRAIVGRTTINKEFRIREEKSFTMEDGTEAAVLLYTAIDQKGTPFASRETYRWVDDNHLLITFEWALISAWRETHFDMEAITATVKVKTFPPVLETQPAPAPAQTHPK
jgi:hypothetical protein